MTRATTLRLAVFGSWIATLIICFGVFLWRGFQSRMTWAEMRESCSIVMAVITPQLTVMTGFFFTVSREQQDRIANADRNLTALVIVCSVLYHVTFWACLLIGFGRLGFGDLLDENAKAIVQIVGYVSALGLAPVTYLFASAATRPAPTPPAPE